MNLFKNYEIFDDSSSLAHWQHSFMSNTGKSSLKIVIADIVTTAI